MLIREMHRLAIRHSWYGYRRITVLFRREGWKVNKKGIWRTEGLSLSLRRPRRRRVGPVAEIVNKEEYPNHVRSYDFVDDRTERGGKLRILDIIDKYASESLVIRIVLSIPALTVVGVLEWLFLTRRVPKFILSDNRSDFAAKAVCQWLKAFGCSSLFIKPGSP